MHGGLLWAAFEEWAAHHHKGGRRLFFGMFEARPGWPCALPRWPSSRRHRSEQQPVRLGRGMPVQTDRSAGTVVVRRPFFERGA